MKLVNTYVSSSISGRNTCSFRIPEGGNAFLPYGYTRSCDTVGLRLMYGLQK